MKKIFDNIPLPTLVFACLTLGLAPFAPPHVYEKLVMLFNGELVKPIDWADLFLHGTPWVLLDIKLILMALNKKSNN